MKIDTLSLKTSFVYRLVHGHRAHFVTYLPLFISAAVKAAAGGRVPTSGQGRVPQESLPELLVHGGVDDKVHPGVGYGHHVEEPINLAGHPRVVVEAHHDHSRCTADQENPEDRQEEFDALHRSFTDVRRISCPREREII